MRVCGPIVSIFLAGAHTFVRYQLVRSSVAKWLENPKLHLAAASLMLTLIIGFVGLVSKPLAPYVSARSWHSTSK